MAAPNQVSSELAGESVILNVKTGLYYGLNAVGASIWGKIQSPKTFQELCDAITAEYDVPPEHCVADIHELLEEMIAADLIQVS
ncbi:MAG: PqqD family protein [Cyanobacteria bacterium P01_F01_bin.3]